MEIYNNKQNNYISVWLTKEEQQIFNREELTKLLLANKNKKCKIIFFLSGKDDLHANVESLVIRNLRCA